MFFQDIFKNKKVKSESKQKQPKAFFDSFPYGMFFNGEKDYFTMNSSMKYNVDYYKMANNAYNLYVTNEFVKAGVDRLVQFMVGTGLELYPIPKIDFLKRKYGIELNENFKKDIKDLWELNCSELDVSSDWQSDIHQLAKIVAFNTVLGGDCLVIRRVIFDRNEYQLVDGRNVSSSKTYNEDTKNKIKNGVEIDEKGRHVAYYILDDDGKEKRIAARDSDGNLYAWLVYANAIRIGSTRGYSILGAIMQKLDKIADYTENEVQASAINGKFVATIDQDETSTGINIFDNKTLGSSSSRMSELQEEKHEDKNLLGKLFTHLKQFTNGLVFQMPRGQKLNAYDTKRPNVNFGVFLDANMKYDFASMGLPYEVVLMVFQNNFSASRASLKMFEAILKFMRRDICVNGFYKHVYEQFVDLEVLIGNLEAPRYIELRNKRGYADNAYLLAKFEGMPIPHIDPVKEVNAVVTKLKNGLTDFEGALQELGSKTNFETLYKSLAEQIKKLKEAGIELQGITEEFNADENEDEEDDEKNVQRTARG